MTPAPDTILRMFRDGLDTHEIAKQFAMPESTVSRHLWSARCQELGLPAIFLSRGELKQIAHRTAA